jgi:hypothetical protein
MNAIHDVSRELRDPHGKWTRGGALKRMASEAASARAPKSAEEITGHVRNLQKGTGRTIGGHRIDRTQRDKYRVGLRKEGGGRDTKLYDSPEHAAQALHEGRHHEAGGAAKVAGGARDRAVRDMAGRAPANEKLNQYADALKAAGYNNVRVVTSNSKNHLRVSYESPGGGPAHAETFHEAQIDRRIQIAKDMAAERKSRGTAPAAGERPYQHTPDAALREMVGRGGNQAATQELARRMEATAKARQEAEDKASGRGGVTRNTAAGAGVGRPDLAGGATPPKTAGRPPVKNLADIQRATDTLREQSRMAKQYERDRRAGVPPESRAGAAGRPPARGEIMEGRAPMPERLRPGGGSKNFPNGTHVSIIGGKYSGEDGEVISGGDPLRPGLIQVRRADGSTILVRESNAANAKMSREEMIARQGDYLKKAGAMQPTERQQAINLTTINGQIRRAQDIVEDPASVSKFGQAEVDRQKARLVQLRKRRAAMTQSGPSGSSSLGEVLSKSPRSRQAPRY